MKIQIKNLGILKQAEFTLGDLTIICGHNNTGKTYAAYALYGFLFGWKHHLSPAEVKDTTIDTLLTHGIVCLDMKPYTKQAATTLQKVCASYTKVLPKILVIINLARVICFGILPL